jgi:hypothetical protein
MYWLGAADWIRMARDKKARQEMGGTAYTPWDFQPDQQGGETAFGPHRTGITAEGNYASVPSQQAVMPGLPQQIAQAQMWPQWQQQIEHRKDEPWWLNFLKF